METPLLYLKSLAVGIAIAAPVGPIGILCIKNVLSYGLGAGIAAGFGAALADSMYGLLAAFGISVLTTFLVDNLATIKLGGGIFLIYLGIKEARSQVPTYSTQTIKKSYLNIIGSTFFLTLTNTMTILTFISIFSLIGGAICCSITQSVVMVAGIFTGSMAWWLFLSSLTRYMHRYLPDNLLHKISIFSGFILIAFGTYAITSLLA